MAEPRGGLRRPDGLSRRGHRTGERPAGRLNEVTENRATRRRYREVREARARLRASVLFQALVSTVSGMSWPLNTVESTSWARPPTLPEAGRGRKVSPGFGLPETKESRKRACSLRVVARGTPVRRSVA